ncbi:MAG: glycine--tRNA ligase subunit beta [Campylobacteraceae bacterium]|nr:glycine--tRNA ligase subunit beta [Campylobacteraceae bacterium]
MIKPLLIEVGVEELPAIPFLKELPNIKAKWLKILESAGLACQFEFYYTPRRLVLWHSKFPTKQPTRCEEFFGAPLHVAYDELGNPTAAANSFAKKCGVSTEEVGESEKDGKKVLYFKKEVPGVESKKLLGKMIGEWLHSLNFGKSMRWGSLEDSFIRPVRSIAAMLDDVHVPCSIFGVHTTCFTYPHRSISYEPLTFLKAGDYFKTVENGGVVLDQNSRRSMIENQMEILEKNHSIKIEKDKDLMAEVVAITEYPTALLGKFDEKFLVLPPEVIVTSMKEHQRYFPVFEDGKLSNYFLVVSNALSSKYDLIVSGNEKVLRARLEDALFFWENDLRNGLSSEGLKKIVYLDGLGSMYDKVLREQKIGAYLGESYLNALKKESPSKEGQALLSLLGRTLGLCKADLLSEMVCEFTELQGVMGYYYAKSSNQDPLLALAFKEQYLPNSEESALPSTLFSAIVALSFKIDSLLALFSIGKIPTGTKDPFALRRAVSGIIKIILAFDLPFNIKNDLTHLAKNYNEFDLERLESFFIERMYAFFEVNPSIINAVLGSGERDIVKIYKKIAALKAILDNQDFKAGFTTFNRVANIVKDIDLKDLNVNSDLFEAPQEFALWEAFSVCEKEPFKSYESRLDSLFALKSAIDEFFDGVMVNAPDATIAKNRQHLIASIYRSFLEIADIKEISF